MRLREEASDTPAVVVRDPDGEPALIVAPGILDGRAFAVIGLALARFDERSQHVEDLRQVDVSDLVDDRVHRSA